MTAPSLLSVPPNAAGPWPVLDWDPPHCGHSGMAIDRAGRPYLQLDAGLRALLARPVYHALAEAAAAEGGDPPGLWSHGAYMDLRERD
jgi:hypothetical protein